MTNRIEESVQLTGESLNRLKGIYASLACTIEIADKRRRQDWMKAILDHQSEKTGRNGIDVTEKPEISSQLQDLQEQVHVIRYAWAPVASQPRSSPDGVLHPADFAKTCATCTLFKPFADGTSRGLCCGSDTVSRDYHPQTGDCLHMIEAAENPDAKLPEGLFRFKPTGRDHAYEVWIGDTNYGAIRILQNGQWVQSREVLGREYSLPRASREARGTEDSVPQTSLPDGSFRPASFAHSYAPVTTQYGTPYAALVEAAQLRDATHNDLEIISQTNDTFIVRDKKGCQFVVQPNHPEPRKRCECADCICLGVPCQHQLAVVLAGIEQLLDKPFDELTASEWEYMCDSLVTESRQPVRT